MGIYINPQKGTKEEWLEINATLISEESFVTHKPGLAGLFTVCLVDNVALGFTAAAVAFSEEEARRFADPFDGRPRKYYLTSLMNLGDGCIPKPYFDELKEIAREANSDKTAAAVPPNAPDVGGQDQK